MLETIKNMFKGAPPEAVAYLEDQDKRIADLEAKLAEVEAAKPPKPIRIPRLVWERSPFLYDREEAEALDIKRMCETFREQFQKLNDKRFDPFIKELDFQLRQVEPKLAQIPVRRESRHVSDAVRAPSIEEMQFEKVLVQHKAERWSYEVAQITGTLRRLLEQGNITEALRQVQTITPKRNLVERTSNGAYEHKLTQMRLDHQTRERIEVF